MDTALLILASLCVVGLGYLYLRLASRMLLALRSLMERPVTAIRKLRPGPVEVSGRLLTDSPLRNHLNRSCAVLDVELRSEWKMGATNVTVSQERRRLFLAPGLTLRDASGFCRIVATPDTTRLSSDPICRVYEPHEQDLLLHRCPHYRPLVVPGAKVILVERSIRAKGRVVVTGHASPDENAEPQHYRDGVGSSFKISAPIDRHLLIARGTRGQALARLSGPLLLGFVIVGATGYTAWMTLRLALAF
ncbi:MAG: hypothetical protein RMJ98_11500 [Myxococcales bacterium]|nr:hypothetical protein [Polyangiaceae bacterium]MDW8249913.1 hypothetical protein [Myxococcales bacterium]